MLCCGGAGVLAELDAQGVAAVQNAIVQAAQARPAAEDEEAAGVCLALHQTTEDVCAVLWIRQAMAGLKLSLEQPTEGCPAYIELWDCLPFC